jgi:hypothetical protein
LMPRGVSQRVSVYSNLFDAPWLRVTAPWTVLVINMRRDRLVPLLSNGSAERKNQISFRGISCTETADFRQFIRPVQFMATEQIPRPGPRAAISQASSVTKLARLEASRSSFIPARHSALRMKRRSVRWKKKNTKRPSRSNLNPARSRVVQRLARCSSA